MNNNSLPKWSISAYLIAIWQRSSKTLVVEGISDVQLMSQMILRHAPASSTHVIDHAGFFKSPPEERFGNREKLTYLIESIDNADSSWITECSDKIAILRDREWEGLDFSVPVGMINWHAPVQRPNRFLTSGHSIENYFFDADCIIECLLSIYPLIINNEILINISNNFRMMIGLAFSISYHLKISGDLDRGKELIHARHIHKNNNRYYLNESFKGSAARLGLRDPELALENINITVDEILNAGHTLESLRWLCHGHIGNYTLWACVAHAAQEAGLSREEAICIYKDNKKDRERCQQRWLCCFERAHREPLSECINWLSS